MRENHPRQEGMFSYVSPEARVPKDHPLRPIREMVNRALEGMWREFEAMYSHGAAIDRAGAVPAELQISHRATRPPRVHSSAPALLARRLANASSRHWRTTSEMLSCSMLEFLRPRTVPCRLTLRPRPAWRHAPDPAPSPRPYLVQPGRERLPRPERRRLRRGDGDALPGPGVSLRPRRPAPCRKRAESVDRHRASVRESVPDDLEHRVDRARRLAFVSEGGRRPRPARSTFLMASSLLQGLPSRPIWPGRRGRHRAPPPTEPSVRD